MPISALVLLALALGSAAFIAVVTYRGRPHTPAVETAPPVSDAAVQNPVEAGGGTPPPPPASGAPDFDAHVDSALALFQVRSDWAMWESEVTR